MPERISDERERGQTAVLRRPQPAAKSSTGGPVAPRSPAGLLALQRAVGNRAVQRAVSPAVTLAPAGSMYEAQAERVAAAVISDTTAEPLLDEPLLKLPQLQPQRAAAPNDDGAADGLDAEFAQRLAGARAGSALPETTRSTMEARFGTDFAAVRVHAGAQAGDLAEQITARAFTTGSDIYFNRGEYQPQSRSGQQLLAHELTHVVQQGAAPDAGGPLQLQRAKKSGSAAARRKRKKRNQQQQQAATAAAAAPAAEPEGWVGWGMSKLAGLAGMVGYEGEAEKEGDLSYDMASAEHGEQHEEDDDDEAGFVTLKAIKIKLVDKEDAKFERGGVKGAAEASVSTEGLAGKAEISFELWNGEAEKKVFDWDVAGGKLKGDASIEGFAGVKAEAEATAGVEFDEDSMLPTSMSVSAKAKAFAGLSEEQSVVVKIVDADDRSLVTATGKVGFTLGIGGEYSGNLSWQGGTLQVGGKAKAAIGVGGSIGFQLEIDPMNVGRSFYGYLGSWASWAYNKL